MENRAASFNAEALPSKEKFQVTPIVYMILRRGGEILLLRRKKTGIYSLPAGHMEKGESSADAAVRETGEEVGITVKSEDATFVHIGYFKDLDGQRIAFFHEAEATNWQGEPQVMEPHIHDEVRWVPVNELPENLAPYTRLALQDIAENKLYTEYGW